MGNKKLIKYIETQLKNGYDINSIKDSMLKGGYNLQQIDKAVKEMYEGEEKGFIFTSPMSLIIGVSVILIIIVSLTVFFLMDDKEIEKLGIDIINAENTIERGSTMSFSVKFTGEETSTYNVRVKKEILDKKTNRVLALKEDDEEIITPVSLSSDIDIPLSADPGDYLLRTVVTYSGGKLIDTYNFKVVAVDEPIEEEPEEEPIEEEPVDEPTPEVEPTPETVVPTDKRPNMEGLSSFENLEIVREIAQTNPTEAASYCPKFDFQTSKDLCYEYVGEESGDIRYCDKVHDETTREICYSNVAVKIGNPKLCEVIKKDKRRDSCYLAFILSDSKDYTVCDKVSNEYMKQSCNSLKQLSDINATQLSFYQDLLKENMIQLSLE